jgi:5-methylcytosine-specific restriction enzyme A
MVSPSAALPNFTVGEIYRRRLLHEEYSGQWQGGISTPAEYPIIFLFTGETGLQYGYSDGYQEETGVFLYTGEGQKGSMAITRGNRAILDHQKNGKTLHLFEAIGGGFVRYLGKADLIRHHWRTALDKDSQPRNAVVFELDIQGGAAGVPFKFTPSATTAIEERLWTETLDSVRRRATELPPANATPTQRSRNVYQRSHAVKVYVLRRSGGVCEGCNSPAPFRKPNGEYYLEPHHIRNRADAGPDHPRWVAALCPNCHCRIHYGEDGSRFNQELAERIGRLEARLTSDHV